MPEEQLSKTIKLNQISKYTISGEVLLTTSQAYEVTTGASIQVSIILGENIQLYLLQQLKVQKKDLK